MVGVPMIRNLIGLGYVASLFAVAYVILTDGPSGTYQIGGDSGFIMSGVGVLAAAAVIFVLAQVFTRQIQEADARRAGEAHRRREAPRQHDANGLAQKPEGVLRMSDPAPPDLHLQAAIALGVCKWKTFHHDPDSPLLNLKVTDSDLWTLNVEDGTVWFRLPWDRVTRVEYRHDRGGSFYVYSDLRLGKDLPVQVMFLEAVPMQEYAQAFVDAAEARTPVEVKGTPPDQASP